MRRFFATSLLFFGFFAYVHYTSSALAASVSCGQWSTVPVTCLTTTGTGAPANCTAQSTTCPDGKTVYYCGPPTPSQMCAQAGVGVSDATFDQFNEAIFGAAGPDAALTTPRGIISKLLPYLFTFAGLILFIMILWGGFEMLTGAANPKSQEAGKQRITAAVIGFILLFSSYWLAQIVERVFGISIL